MDKSVWSLYGSGEQDLTWPLEGLVNFILFFHSIFFNNRKNIIIDKLCQTTIIVVCLYTKTNKTMFGSKVDWKFELKTTDK